MKGMSIFTKKKKNKKKLKAIKDPKWIRDRVVFYFDMDGVLAKWQDVSVEETFEKGFFSSRDPEKCIIKALKEMERLGYRVIILSAVYQDDHSSEDKTEWLTIQGLQMIPRIYVPYGESKAKYMLPHHGINILVDDFTKNLREWVNTSTSHVGIKFMNGVNGTKGTWDGYTVSNKMTAEMLVKAITGIAAAEYFATVK